MIKKVQAHKTVIGEAVIFGVQIQTGWGAGSAVVLQNQETNEFNQIIAVTRDANDHSSSVGTIIKDYESINRIFSRQTINYYRN